MQWVVSPTLSTPDQQTDQKNDDWPLECCYQKVHVLSPDRLRIGWWKASLRSEEEPEKVAWMQLHEGFGPQEQWTSQSSLIHIMFGIFIKRVGWNELSCCTTKKWHKGYGHVSVQSIVNALERRDFRLLAFQSNCTTIGLDIDMICPWLPTIPIDHGDF